MIHPHRSRFISDHQMEIADMGTWQVQQNCCQGDGTWWCFEPTHLSKCLKDHLPRADLRHSAPDEPHALYRPLRRGGQPRKRRPRSSAENRAGKSQAHPGMSSRLAGAAVGLQLMAVAAGNSSPVYSSSDVSDAISDD